MESGREFVTIDDLSFFVLIYQIVLQIQRSDQSEEWLAGGKVDSKYLW